MRERLKSPSIEKWDNTDNHLTKTESLLQADFFLKALRQRRQNKAASKSEQDRESQKKQTSPTVEKPTYTFEKVSLAMFICMWTPEYNKPTSETQMNLSLGFKTKFALMLPTVTFYLTNLKNQTVPINVKAVFIENIGKTEISTVRETIPRAEPNTKYDVLLTSPHGYQTYYDPQKKEDNLKTLNAKMVTVKIYCQYDRDNEILLGEYPIMQF